MADTSAMKPLLLSLLLIPSALFALEPAKRESINQLFQATGVRDTVENLRKQNVALVRKQLDDQNAKTEFANNPIMRRLIDRVMMKYEAYTQEIMGWPKWEPKYVALYDESFSDAQLWDTVAFFRSDAGKAWLAFQSKAMVRMQEDAFQQTQATQARIKQIMDETAAEIQAEINAESAKTRQSP